MNEPPRCRRTKARAMATFEARQSPAASTQYINCFAPLSQMNSESRSPLQSAGLVRETYQTSIIQAIVDRPSPHSPLSTTSFAGAIFCIPKIQLSRLPISTYPNHGDESGPDSTTAWQEGDVCPFQPPSSLAGWHQACNHPYKVADAAC